MWCYLSALPENEWWSLCTWQHIYNQTRSIYVPRIPGMDFTCLSLSLFSSSTPGLRFLGLFPFAFTFISHSPTVTTPPTEWQQLIKLCSWFYGFASFATTSCALFFFCLASAVALCTQGALKNKPPLWSCEIVFNGFAKLILLLTRVFRFSKVLRYIEVFWSFCFCFVNK